MTTAEHQRLSEIQDDIGSWRRWGPYVSDRSWATVREDYSDSGDAWSYLPHDLARSKAYRWGEDGIAGICDRYQLLVFAPAFWNGKDPILKERLFGLTPAEGNHGEDVKEYYFHLDNTPTHAYMKFLYKYPHAAYPYQELIDRNRSRGPHEPEYELLDSGVFNDDRYFDIFVEYAKSTPEDICIRIQAVNRGKQPATLHIIPQLWFRNTWAWCPDAWHPDKRTPEPLIRNGPGDSKYQSLVTDDSQLELLSNLPITYKLGPRILWADPSGNALFTCNETNGPRVFGPGNECRKPYVKDAFHRHLVDGEDCVCPERVGTKAGIDYRFENVPPGETVTVRLRLTNNYDLADPLADVDEVIELRQKEADEFYDSIHPATASDDERQIQRQALSGLLWTKQSYIFDVNRWIDGDNPACPPPKSRKQIRNAHWMHLNSMRIMSMPDKWEYPWFAAWDLAFHCVSLALVDPQFAKDQLSLLLFEQFLHPNGQIPAYEWEFSDLNPPVHAWAVWRVYEMDRDRTGKPDREFLETSFHKLLMNFAWWVNKVDSEGNNVFEGGFLGLDNITVVDRSQPCSDGAVIEQADATGWMGMFCLTLMRIALELSKENCSYECLATKFFQHYVYIAAAMKRMGKRDYELWDEVDGFFYDVLRYPDGRFHKLKVRSLVGLIPLFAVERLEEKSIAQFKTFSGCLDWFLRNRRDLVHDVVHTMERDGERIHVLTIVNEDQLSRIAARLWDPGEFLSPYGIRSLSKAHQADPFEFDGRVVSYEPAEAVSKLKGGNSNWRGPIWFPTCYLLMESLRTLGEAYGNTQVTHGKQSLNFNEMATDLADRLISIFATDSHGRRPVNGDQPMFQDDPHWRDYLLFYEYFHADTGAGLGASHQTGWTALVASLIDKWRGEAPQTKRKPRSKRAIAPARI